ncbi:hypothetical protein FOMPIDRAFT_1083095, partial [Fomitopsis schrenkii]
LLLAALVVQISGPPITNYSGLDTGEPTRILLLTAHPDDECMFFAPTLLGLAKSVHRVSGPDRLLEIFSLCLSVGNADGLGTIRRDELGRSLDVLGVPSSRRWVEDRSDLQDNFTAQWDYDTIAAVIRPYVVDNGITTILTFDAYGISGHPNHVSLAYGAERLLSALPSPASGSISPPARPRLFTLVSVPLLQKYTGPWAAILSRADFVARARSVLTQTPISLAQKSAGDRGARPGPTFVAGVREYVTALRAMMQHRSQLVWFRWLYVAFSRYMWVNDWVEI